MDLERIKRLEEARKIGHQKIWDVIKSHICSDKLKEFVQFVIWNADPMFWISPCSGSQKYHPPENQVEGGIVNHILKGVPIIEGFVSREHFTPFEIDAAYAAWILHDICKFGKPWGKEADPRHGIIGSEFILRGFCYHDAEMKKVIADAVRYHMGPWAYAVDNHKETYTKVEMNQMLEEVRRAMSPTRVEKAVQDADYWSSRKDISYLPDVYVK